MKRTHRSTLNSGDWLPILFGGAIFGGVLWQSIYLWLQSIGNDRPVAQVTQALLIALTASMVAVGVGAGLPVLGYFIVFAMLGGR